MNNLPDTSDDSVTSSQLAQFQQLMTSMIQCCNERSRYQSERFDLTEAEFRCLLLFGRERYLTPGGMAQAMNVVKSRITRIVRGLRDKGLVQQTPAPDDSRVSLLSLTPKGRRRLETIESYLQDTHTAVLEHLNPRQRHELIASLGALKVSMETVKDTMI